MVLVASIVALALTLASVACTAVPHGRGGASARRRERVAAVVMGLSALDMTLPGLDLLHAVGWGALLLPAGLLLLVPVPGRGAGVDGGDAPVAVRRADLARHAGSLLVMSAMWWAMAAPGVAGGDVGAAVASGTAHAGHLGGAPLGALVLGVSALLSAGALIGLRRAVRRGSVAALRHPLMTLGMFAMAASMAVA